jgi:hypothetical protein
MKKQLSTEDEELRSVTIQSILITIAATAAAVLIVAAMIAEVQEATYGL